jgi:hypothetical protein
MGSGMAHKECICANECPDKAHLIALPTSVNTDLSRATSRDHLVYRDGQ